MFKVVVFVTVLVIFHPQRTVADCTDSYIVPDPEFVGCYQRSPGQADPFLPYDTQTTVSTATGCVSCCAAETQSFNFAGIVTRPDLQVECTCGQRSEQYYDFITSHGANGCSPCPGNNGQSCGLYGVRVSVYKVPEFNLTTTTTHSIQVSILHSSLETTRSPSLRPSSQPPDVTSVPNAGLSTRPYTSRSLAQTSDSTQRLTSESAILLTTSNMGDSGYNTALIAGSAGGGAAVLLVICGVVAFCLIRKRSSTSKKNNVPPGSINLNEVGGGTGGRRNQTFQHDANTEVLCTNTTDPEDPSYQDVIPTGAQHQYTTVQDDSHPYTSLQDEPNSYTTPQDDPHPYTTPQDDPHPYSSLQDDSHPYTSLQDESHPYTALRGKPNLYDSIKDDHQYYNVQKGRKHDPNVETNPLYGTGGVDNTAYDQEGPLSNDDDRAPTSSVCEMMDNNLYE